MHPLLFGEREAPIFGVHHPPGGDPRDHGIVLCYPFGQEYMRTHRAFRQLARLLSRAGFHVLRFDFTGTGDSHGEMDGVSLETWVGDVHHAVDELREQSGVSRIALVGFRLGALVAARYCDVHGGIDRLVAWDPVLCGAGYVRQLRSEIALDTPREPSLSLGSMILPDGSMHFNGFTLPAPFLESLAPHDLRALVPHAVASVFHVASVEDEDAVAVREAWGTHPGYRYRYAPSPHDWHEVDSHGGILLPQPSIQAIVGWMESHERR